MNTHETDTERTQNAPVSESSFAAWLRERNLIASATMVSVRESCVGLSFSKCNGFLRPKWRRLGELSESAWSDCSALETENSEE